VPPSRSGIQKGWRRKNVSCESGENFDQNQKQVNQLTFATRERGCRQKKLLKPGTEGGESEKYHAEKGSTIRRGARQEENGSSSMLSKGVKLKK